MVASTAASIRAVGEIVYARCRLTQIETSARRCTTAAAATVYSQRRSKIGWIVVQKIIAVAIAVTTVAAIARPLILLREHNDVSRRVHEFLHRRTVHGLTNQIIEIVEVLAVFAINVHVPVTNEILCRAIKYS